MYTQIYGICQHCAAKFSIFLFEKRVIGECKECKKEPINTRPIEGLIYVIHNEYQKGVKIGFTTKSLKERLKSLSSTGVPGEFKAIAAFHSYHTKADEKKVHKRLQRSQLAKEHFDVEPVEAVLATYRALNYREPVFYNKLIEAQFFIRLEADKKLMQLKLSGGLAKKGDHNP